MELLGSSDSECDFSAIQGGSSDRECSDAVSCEDMYSEHEHHSDSGESSGSNYESSSSFEARKAKHHTKSSHGSATSKAAAKGRKDRMIANRAVAYQNSPQSVYLKNKHQTPKPIDSSISAKKRKAPSTPESSAGSSSQQSACSDNSGSDSPESDPAVSRKGKGKGKAKAPAKKQSSVPRKPKQAAKDTPPDYNANAGKRTKKGKGVKLPVRRIEGEYEGSQEAGVPLVDSRPGKKHTRAGRKRKDSRRGRNAVPSKAVSESRDEPQLINEPAVAVLPTKKQLQGQKAVEDCIEEDPMLESEIIRPLIVNEMADNGRVIVNEMVDGMKVWDAEVSCNGGYHWYCGDINWHTFPDPPVTPTFVPNGTPGPNIENLAQMHPIVVLERFLPMQFWTNFTQETNAYRERCAKDPSLADADEEDVMDSLYYINWRSCLSVPGKVL